MNATKQRDATLKQLRATRRQMMSTQWCLTLEAQDEETQTAAARTLLGIQHAIRKLENQRLAGIRDALRQNESSLIDGRNRLENALKNLERVTEVLDAAANILKVIGRIVKLIF